MPISHFHFENGWWPRGKAARFRQNPSGEYVHCQLDFKNGYWLLGDRDVLFDAAAHERHAHVEFLRIGSPEDLLKFVEQWGPVAIGGQEWKSGESLLPTSRYLGIQRKVRNLVDFFCSIRNGKNRAQHLGEFLRLRDGMVYSYFETARARGNYPPAFVDWLGGFAGAVHRLPQLNSGSQVERGKEGEIAALLDSAPRSHVVRLMKLALENSGQLRTTLQTRRRDNRRSIYPRFFAKDLHDALEGMIILDEWAKHPLQVCEECAKLFRGETRHDRRYCSPECSRRVSSRESRRKQRLHQRRHKGEGRVE